MNLNPYQPSTRRLFVLSSLLVCSLMIFQPLPETIATSHEQSVVVVAARAHATTPAAKRSGFQRRPPSPLVNYPKNTTQGVGVKVEKKKQVKVGDVLSKLGQLGPAFPAAYSLSNFTVEGPVKGKWPIVIVYELEADSTAEVTINTQDGKLRFPIQLAPTNGERREVKAQVPETFGQKPQLGMVSFKAFKNGPEPKQAAHFFLYGLGVGDKAVGSLVIVQLQFRPRSIHPTQKEKVTYSFQSRSDFNRVAAEFFLVVKAADSSTHKQLAFSREFKNGARPGQTLEGDWDGKNSKGKISVGPHQFHVRAWRGLQDGGDWTYVAEAGLIKVEKE
jgi:hypothetical protein